MGKKKSQRSDSLHKLKEVLKQRRAMIQAALAGDMSRLEQLNNVGDIGDYAAFSETEEIGSRLAEVESQELADIDSALAKFESDTYGDCERCDSPIPLSRLRALPYAKNCIGCQRESEEEDEWGYQEDGE